MKPETSLECQRSKLSPARQPTIYGTGHTPPHSVPEVVHHGVTGFVVETVKEAVAAVREIDTIDRGTVRAAFERRFSVDVMAKNYELAYAQIQTTRDLDIPEQFEGVNGLMPLQPARMGNS